ncbi:hypothetical protein [Microbulbifer magnicolonia]|uniref:hypothetical protein n=1 Tax=Microbulbifer magnicolonia TaxID=3109744 RepID=UPI002B402028|nr:hypothetical protein [Microbulbifer sp. GG15]
MAYVLCSFFNFLNYEAIGKWWTQEKLSTFVFLWPLPGGKTSYRGDKIARSIWRELLPRRDYLAQAHVPAAQRYLEMGVHR